MYELTKNNKIACVAVLLWFDYHFARNDWTKKTERRADSFSKIIGRKCKLI